MFYKNLNYSNKPKIYVYYIKKNRVSSNKIMWRNLVSEIFCSASFFHKAACVTN